jgi:site-specific DNA recombinase
MRAAIYARVSTEEQAQNFSIENQLDNLRRYCRQRGYSVTGEYVDPGWSGTIIERPALTKLLDDARAGLIDTVVVYKLDRLFRSNRHMYNTLAEWEERGISLSSVTEPFDTTTTMGKAYLGMASTFAEWERNTFMERSRDGTRKAVEKGLYSGGIVAYGYRLNPDTKRLEVDERESKVVADMFRWLADDGMTTYSIARRLNALGIPTRYAKDGRGIRGKATAGVWRPGRVYNMLRNPAYMGEWEYGKRGRKRQLVKCACPALIDSETFGKAQARLRENNLWADRNSRRPYLLRGLIKCGICGHAYVGSYSHSGKNERRYYKCDRKANRGSLLSQACCSPSVRGDVVEDLIWEQICQFIQDRETIQEAFRNKFDACQQATYVAELAQTKRRLNELKLAEQRLLVKYADPANNYSEGALEGALAEIRNNVATVKIRITELESTIATDEERIHKLNDVQDILDSLKEAIPDASLEVKRKVFKELVKEVRVGKTEDGTPLVNIVYWFSKDFTKANSDVRLHSSRMSLWLLRRPISSLHLPAGPGIPLPEKNKWPLS